MDLALTDLARSAADSDILQRTAITAHGMAFEMGQDDHRIIVYNVAAHGDFLQVLAAADRQIDRAFFIYDIDRAESPAIDLQRFPMRSRRIAVPFIERIGFDNRTVRDMGHKGFDHIPRQDIGAIFFAGMQFDGDFAINAFIDLIIKGNQMGRINMLGKVDLSP